VTPDLSTPAVLDQIANLASQVGERIAAEFGNGSGGGYLFICDEDGRQLLHKRIASPAPEKRKKYVALSREKAVRLLRHVEHLLSWQSRDPENNKWGGAIRLPSGHIISFSGFPELVDEALCMSLARFLKLIGGEEVDAFAKVGANDNFEPVHRSLCEATLAA